MYKIKIIAKLSEINNLDETIHIIQKQMNVIGGNSNYIHIEKALKNAFSPSNKSVLFLCISENKEIQAFAFGNKCAGLETGADYFWINELFVDVNYRKQNIATEILNFIKLWAKDNYIKYIACSTSIKNIPAQNLYKKNGFDVNETMWVDKVIE